jgi:hypothetical protein
MKKEPIYAAKYENSSNDTMDIVYSGKEYIFEDFIGEFKFYD